MADRAAEDVISDLKKLVADGAERIYTSIDDYELVMASATIRYSPPGTQGPIEFDAEPSWRVGGAPVEWRMDYSGPPTTVDPGGPSGIPY
jgi:hypothetical protein